MRCSETKGAFEIRARPLACLAVVLGAPLGRRPWSGRRQMAGRETARPSVPSCIGRSS